MHGSSNKQTKKKSTNSLWAKLWCNSVVSCCALFTLAGISGALGWLPLQHGTHSVVLYHYSLFPHFYLDVFGSRVVQRRSKMS